MCEIGNIKYIHPCQQIPYIVKMDCNQQNVLIDDIFKMLTFKYIINYSILLVLIHFNYDAWSKL
jgi:hypothetical protein